MYMCIFQMTRVLDTRYKAKCDFVLQQLSLLIPVMTLKGANPFHLRAVPMVKKQNILC